MKTPILCAVVMLCLSFYTSAVTGKKPSSELYPGYKETILEAREVACVARVLEEMNKRKLSYNRLQMVIRSAGDAYSILFIENASAPSPKENDSAIEWHVRKRDLKVEGPIFQR
jgi:hypothetical protein